MSFSRETIKYLHHLARLEENTRDEDSIQDNLNRIVAMVDQISSANTEGVLSMEHPFEATYQPLRPDVVTEPNDREELLKLAPLANSGLFLVPTVIE
jgi:aspartyl-tRNA(Asn)/glutamyl-tRNA(Gln) amidotransferase subunit C